jgi:hypothetical protein
MFAFAFCETFQIENEVRMKKNQSSNVAELALAFILALILCRKCKSQILRICIITVARGCGLLKFLDNF